MHTEIAALFCVTRENSSRHESQAKKRLQVALAPLVDEPTVMCVVCGKPVPQRILGRPRRYCRNDECRYAARKLLKEVA